MALRRTLHQLAGMHAPDATLWLQGWEWPAVADTLAECLPLLPHLAFGVQWNGPLTDERLAVVMRMGPHMCRLSVDSVALQSDHSGVVWPWSVLCVEKLGVAQLLELPVPSHDAHLRAHKLEMDTCKDLSEVRTTHILCHVVLPTYQPIDSICTAHIRARSCCCTTQNTTC